MKFCFVLLAVACHFLRLGVLDFSIVFGAVFIVYQLWTTQTGAPTIERKLTPYRLRQEDTILKTLAERMATEVIGQHGTQATLQMWHTWAVVRTQEAYNSGIKDFHKMLTEAAEEANANAPHKGALVLVPLNDIAQMADVMTRAMDQSIWDNSLSLDQAIKEMERT